MAPSFLRVRLFSPLGWRPPRTNIFLPGSSCPFSWFFSPFSRSSPARMMLHTQGHRFLCRKRLCTSPCPPLCVPSPLSYTFFRVISSSRSRRGAEGGLQVSPLFFVDSLGSPMMKPSETFTFLTTESRRSFFLGGNLGDDSPCPFSKVLEDHLFRDPKTGVPGVVLLFCGELFIRQMRVLVVASPSQRRSFQGKTSNRDGHFNF